MIRNFVLGLSVAVLGAGVASPVMAYTEAELEFLTDARRGISEAGYSDIVYGLTDDNLLGVANSTCSALTAGVPIEAIADRAIVNANDPSLPAYSQTAIGYILGYSIASGVYFLCPQHSQQVAEYFRQNAPQQPTAMPARY